MSEWTTGVSINGGREDKKRSKVRDKGDDFSLGDVQYKGHLWDTQEHVYSTQAFVYMH